MNREDLDEQLKENGLAPKHKEPSFRVGQRKLALLAVALSLQEVRAAVFLADISVREITTALRPGRILFRRRNKNKCRTYRQSEIQQWYKPLKKSDLPLSGLLQEYMTEIFLTAASEWDKM